MNGISELQQIDIKINEINAEIQTKEGSKKTGIILMVVSVFMLWPLLIVGGIMYSNANNRIKALEQERNNLQMRKNMILQGQGDGNLYNGYYNY